MPDVTFEVKFSQLVDSAMKEKVPALLEYRVGFQVIDKNEEETKAVGVSVFVVQGLWLYMPIFFIEGELKGTDLLYVKQNDLFVPARDNWITSFKEQGAVILGSSSINKNELGGAAEGVGATGVNLQDNNSILFKIAGKTDKYVADLKSTGKLKKPTYKKLTTTGLDPIPLPDANSGGAAKRAAAAPTSQLNLRKAMLSKESSTDLGIRDALKDMIIRHGDAKYDFTEKIAGLGGTAQVAFANTLRKSPEFANALFTFYSPGDMQKLSSILAGAAEKLAAEEEAKQEPTQIEIITSTSDAKAAKLTDSEKKALVKQGVFVEDKRLNFSKIFHNRIEPGVTQNPTESGIYDILMADGSWKPAVVLFFNKLGGSTYCGEPSFAGEVKSPIQKVAIIPMDDNQRYFSRQVISVFCKAPSIETIKKFTGAKGGIEANPSTITKELVKKEKGEGGYVPPAARCLISNGVAMCYEVQLPCQKEFVNNVISVSSGYDNDQYDIEFTGKDGKLSFYANRLFVPKAARVFLPAKWDEERNFNLGNVTQIFSNLIKEASLDSLTVQSNGGTAQITVNDKSTGLLDKVAAIRYLSEGVGLYAGQAQQILKEASRKKDNRVSYLLKIAAPYDLEAYEGKAPFMGGPAAATDQGVVETTDNVGGKAQENMLPEEVISKANRAAETGIKEVFDTSVLEGLIDIADLSELRKDYIKDMIKGMDRVGRMMFLFYWHNEEFGDRYGEEDMKKLEDTLKQVFVSVGDLVLFLKEKVAHAPDSSESVLGSLSEDIGDVSTATQGGI